MGASQEENQDSEILNVEFLTVGGENFMANPYDEPVAVEQFILESSNIELQAEQAFASALVSMFRNVTKNDILSSEEFKQALARSTFYDSEISARASLALSRHNLATKTLDWN